MDRLEGTYSVRSSGAFGDGAHDDTGAIQDAIDKAAEKGGNVYIPPGRYMVRGALEVRPGVTVYGRHNAPCGHTQLVGTVILAGGGKGDEDGPPLFHLHDSSMVQGVTIYYPEQRVDDIQPYPWTFQLDGADRTVENVTLVNSYQGIRVGPELNCRHRIRSVHGCVLRRGIRVDNCVEIGRVENCQLHPHWWSHESVGGDWDKVKAYMEENLEAYTFGRTDWEYLTNNFVFAAKVGWRFIHTENGECNGHMSGCGADDAATAIQVEQLQRMGLLVTAGEFVSIPGNDPCQVRVSETCTQGSLRFVNCAFWGLSNRVAELSGDAYVSFNDCFFTNWKEGVDENPLLVANAGRLQVNNCSFDTHHPCVFLGPDVKHAILRGNNGKHGFSVTDETGGGRTVIGDNEPPC